MRVGQSGNSSVQGSEVYNAKKTGRAGDASKSERADRPQSAALADSAAPEISSKAKDLAKAKAVAAETPDVREQKIAELKKRISEGSYKVDARATADRLVDEHMKFGGIG